MTEQPISRVLSQLRHKSAGERQWLACCPCHPDETESLSIAEASDGKVLLHCHVGCDTQDIARAIGLEMKNLFPRRGDEPRQEHRQVAATYTYTNESGRPLYRKVRTIPKSFYQQASDGRGGWTNSMKGVQQVPYRLPELLDGIRDGRLVWIVEGEKDCDTLHSLGEIATTSSGGAGKWPAELNCYFAGARVVVIADDDEPGHKQARRIGNDLSTVAKSTKVILSLPGANKKGFDVSDYLNQGGTIEKLQALAEQAAEWEPSKKETVPEIDLEAERPKISIRRMSEVTPEVVGFLWPPYVPLGKVTILEGHPGMGKSYLSLDLAAKVTTGQVPADGKPGNVALLTCEDGLGDTIRNRLDTLGADCERVFHFSSEHGIELSDEEHWKSLLSGLEKIKPTLIIIDPIQGFIGRDVDLNRANSVRWIMSRLAALAEDMECSILLIRHLTKGTRDSAILRGSGSVDFAAAARCIILVGKNPNNPEQAVMVHTKHSLTEQGPSLAFEINEGGLVWHGPTSLTAADLLQPEQPGGNRRIDEVSKLLTELLNSGPMPAKAIFEACSVAGYPEVTVKRAKALLGITSSKPGIGSGWMWQLPGHEGLN